MQTYNIKVKNTDKNYQISSELKLEILDDIVISVAANNFLARVVNKTDKNVENMDFSILRKANKNDYIQYDHNLEKAKNNLADIKNTVAQFAPKVKVGFVDYSLDGKKLTISYTSDDRVDYREMVKKLAQKFACRIEMRQIGNRDEVSRIGAIGSCGQVCCCKLWLKEFDKVSIKMAKNQNIALNPSKINGMCGRLLCCLKYEDDLYKEQLAKMPKVGSFISTPAGKGKVLYNDLLKEIVTVSVEKGDSYTRESYLLTELETE